MNSPGLQWCPRPRRRFFTRPFNHRLGQTIPEPEMVMGVVEWRRRVQIQKRQATHPVATGHQLVVYPGGPGVFGVIASEQDRDRVQVVSSEPADPVIGMAHPGVSKDVGAGRHALAKSLRKGGQRFLGNPERPQAFPGERQRDPPFGVIHRCGRRCRGLDDGNELGQPRPAPGGVVEREEFVAPGHGRSTGQQDVLNVFELKHVRTLRL